VSEIVTLFCSFSKPNKIWPIILLLHCSYYAKPRHRLSPSPLLFLVVYCENSMDVYCYNSDYKYQRKVMPKDWKLHRQDLHDLY